MYNYITKVWKNCLDYDCLVSQKKLFKHNNLYPDTIEPDNKDSCRVVIQSSKYRFVESLNEVIYVDLEL